jgi:hypothetical protein
MADGGRREGRRREDLTLFPPRRGTYNLNALQLILILNPILGPTRVLGLVDRFEIRDWKFMQNKALKSPFLKSKNTQQRNQRNLISAFLYF